MLIKYFKNIYYITIRLSSAALNFSSISSAEVIFAGVTGSFGTATATDGSAKITS